MFVYILIGTPIVPLNIPVLLISTKLGDFLMICVTYSVLTLLKKATIHQVTTMIVTSKNIIFPGPNHLLTTGTDAPAL